MTPGWRATVDGRPSAVVPADYVDMAVAVPPGTHVIRLGFDDPFVGYGLLGSAISIGILLAAALVLHIRARPRPRTRPG